MSDQQQQYDASLKALVQEQPAEILPYFLPGVIFERTLDVEISRPTMRADRVFRVRYLDELHVLHIEFESSADSNMAARLLTYHSVIYQDYQLPVISIIVYPFKVTMARPPLEVISKYGDILKFRFQVLPLWKMEATEYVQNHAVAMYTLLPTMNGANEDLLIQAIEEMAKAYESDEAKLARQLIWMGILLRRSNTLLLDTKRKVEQKLNGYDKLWEEDPKIQAYGANQQVKGEMQALRRATLTIVRTRFPGALEAAQKKLEQIQDAQEFYQLLEQISAASNEATVRWLLSKPAA